MQIAYTIPHRIHRLLTGIRPDVLNDSAQSPQTDNLIAEMNDLIHTLQTEAFDDGSQRVNYEHLKQSETYQAYRHLTTALQYFDLHSLTTDAEKLAFWINLYNMLAIDAVLHYGVQSRINEVSGVFYRAGYNVGGYFFSLHDIEQGILRANRGHPAVPGAQFGEDDPRSQHVMTTLEPRTHFALVCAAESCPPIRVYDADKIDAQLTLATKHFINSSEVRIDLDKKRANISKIFQWYAPDFGASFSVTLGFGDATPILHWLADYRVDADEQAQLKQNVNDFSVRFLPYDWSLNRQI